MEILSALIIGFAGSFHCVGMCGPIAIALPITSKNHISFISNRLFYNFGRILSYMFLGLALGTLGGKINMAGLQQGLSISLGVFILTALIVPSKYRNLLLGYPLIQAPINYLKFSMSSHIKKSNKISFFILGVLNGFLPCGFVYIGLAGAASTADPVKGLLFMLLFGIGTLPAMLAASVFGKIINLNIRRKLTLAIPYLASAMAILLIIRGMNLGIPYLSPKLPSTNIHQVINCH
jgi:uncharacterized protein